MADLYNNSRPTRPADGLGGPAGGEPPLGDLIRQLAQDSATLVRQEVALAKAEIRENVRSVGRDVAMIAIGGIVALLGVLVLIAFLVIVLGEVIGEAWAGALIVGVLFLAIGGFMAMKFLGNLKHETLAPERTIETLKEDKQWLQSEIKQVKRDLA